MFSCSYCVKILFKTVLFPLIKPVSAQCHLCSHTDSLCCHFKTVLSLKTSALLPQTSSLLLQTSALLLQTSALLLQTSALLLRAALSLLCACSWNISKQPIGAQMPLTNDMIAVTSRMCLLEIWSVSQGRVTL